MTNLQLAVADPGENHERGKTKLAAVNRNHMPSFARSHNRKRSSLERLTVSIKGMRAPRLRDDVKQDYSVPLLIAEKKHRQAVLSPGKTALVKT